MTELDNATKSPESDAQEQQTQLTPETVSPDDDAPAQTAPSTGEHCVTDRPTRV
jgi:hypothetical protein